MQNLQLIGKGHFGKTTVSVDVPVMLFEEENLWYAYLPSFDLTGYGHDANEARESLKITLDEFIRYTLNKKTFFEELKRLGWEIKRKNKPFKAPSISDLMKENEELKELVDMKRYSKDIYSVNLPAYV